MAAKSRPVSMPPLQLIPETFDLEKRRDVARKVSAVMQGFNSSPRADEAQNNRIMQSFIKFAVKGVRPSRPEVEEVEIALFTKAQEPQDLFRKYLLFSGYAYSLDGLVELSQEKRCITDILLNNDLDPYIIELPHDIRAVDQAAKIVGCDVAHIVKSQIFRTEQTFRPILVLSSAQNSVDERKIAYSMNENVVLADDAFVYETTRFHPASVSAIGLWKQIDTFIDEDLLKFKEVWANAGSTHTLFRVNPAMLEKLTGGTAIQTKLLG